MVAPPRFKDALEILAKHRVDLVVVGGVAAVLSGAPIATFDPDVVTISVGSAKVRVLSLSALIQTKEEAGREKDLAVLGILRRTLLESGKK
jgi:hypothetical protein